MSNYTQVTFFAPKDALLSGDPNKIIHGTQVDPELAAIATAISSKFDVQNMGSIVQLAIGSGAVGAPSYSFAADTTTGWYLSAVGVLAAATGGVQRVTIGSSGNWTINAAASGSTLTVNGAANNYAQTITASSTAGQSFGTIISAGTNASDDALVVRNQSGSSNFLVIGGNGAGSLGPSGSLGLSWGVNGNVTINVQTSGNNLVLPALNGNGMQVTAADLPAVQLFANSTVNLSLRAWNAGSAGLVGTTTAHALNLRTNDTDRIIIGSTGNITANAPSGGITATIFGADRITQLNNTSTGNSLLQFTGNGTNRFSIGWGSGTTQFIIFDDAASAYRLTLSTTGNFVINAPTSGRHEIDLAGTSGEGFRISGLASGTSSSFTDFYDSTNAAVRGYIGFGSSLFTGAAIADFGIAGNTGILRLSANAGATTHLAIANAGNVTISQPSSGTSLTINTNDAVRGVIINAPSGATQGMLIDFEVNGADQAYIGLGPETLSGAALKDLALVAAVSGGVIRFSPNGFNGTTFLLNGQNAPTIQGYGPVAAALVDMTPDKGTFLMTLTGMSSATTVTAQWSRNGNQVILNIPAVTGTSNVNTFTCTGLPAAIQPANQQAVSVAVADLGGAGPTVGSIMGQISGGTITWFSPTGASNGFGNTAAKGFVLGATLSYELN